MEAPSWPQEHPKPEVEQQQLEHKMEQFDPNTTNIKHEKVDSRSTR